MALSKEQLMQERYKVIADHPNQLWPIGTVLTIDRRNVFSNSDHPLKLEPYPQKYPAIFQKLEWWEGRGLSDMPEYLKVNTEKTSLFLGNIFKVRMWKIRAAGLFYCWLEEDKRKSMADLFKYDPEDFLPADESEYHQYLLTQNNKS